MAGQLREAAASGENTRLARLLSDGVKPLPDEHGRSPLLIAAAAGHAGACEVLLLYGVDVNGADNGFVVAHALMEKKSEEAYTAVYKYIFDEIAPELGVNMKIHMDFEKAERNTILNVVPTASIQPCAFHYYQSGVTSVQRAAAEGHLQVVQLLLKHGADVSRQDNVHGDSALHEASWRGYSRTVATLAKALGTQRAPLHARNLSGFAPLHLACQNGHNQSCRELLLAGCNPDLQNNYGDTPLHTSARYGHAGVTRILISGLCRVSDQNKNGDTALHIAVAMGRRKLTRILLEANCDRSLRNKQGETAKDIARRKNLSEILEIMNKSRSKSHSRLKSEDKVAAKILEQKSSKDNKKREKTGSGTSGSRDSGTKKEKKKQKNGKDHQDQCGRSVMGRQWSPYGCHYYPDPEVFPQPKLDSLPSDPLSGGEQYYLDLAGNIRKGPVGVGYTCYCAPFFRHIEAKLERDKAELKARIDEAHERLDLKVVHLERRTKGQISELSRCVAVERSKCEEHHAHLRRWLIRASNGRRSERPSKPISNDINNAPIRARSLEDLLDARSQDRSFEIPGENNGHRDSFENLDIPAIPRLSKSCRDISMEDGRSLSRVRDVTQRLNGTSDKAVSRDRISPLGAAASPTISSKHQIMKQQRPCNYDTGHSNEGISCKIDGKSDEVWRSLPSRGNVHEIIKRFQKIPGMHNSWRTPLSVSSEQTSCPDHCQSLPRQRVQPQGTAMDDWHAEGQNKQSESSEAEEDVDPSRNSDGNIEKHYDRASDNSHYDSIAKMPYRSRSAVYSPSPVHHDAHNDSGYGTRLYGSSKCASPSLSGQLECDVILPPTEMHYPNATHPSTLLEQPKGHDITVYERSANNIIMNIGTASLV